MTKSTPARAALTLGIVAVASGAVALIAHSWSTEFSWWTVVLAFVGILGGLLVLQWRTLRGSEMSVRDLEDFSAESKAFVVVYLAVGAWAAYRVHRSTQAYGPATFVLASLVAGLVGVVVVRAWEPSEDATDQHDEWFARVLVGSMLAVTAAGLLVGGIWGVLGAVTRGTDNIVGDAEIEPLFADVKVPVTVVVIVCAALVLLALIVRWFSPRRVVQGALILVAVGGFLVLLLDAVQRNLGTGSVDAFGSGLPALREGWVLAVLGCATALVAAFILGEARIPRLGMVAAGLVAVTIPLIIGQPATYAGSVRVEKLDVRDVTAPIPSRVSPTAEPVDDQGVENPLAIGPGYFADNTMYNADTGSVRWRIDVAPNTYGRYSDGGTKVYPESGMVLHAVERPDGVVESRGIDAVSGDVRWESDRSWELADPSYELRRGFPGVHLTEVRNTGPSSDDDVILAVGSPETGETLWEYRTGCAIHDVADGRNQVLLNLYCGNGSSLMYLDAQTGRELRRIDDVAGSWPGILPNGLSSDAQFGWENNLDPIRDRYDIDYQGFGKSVQMLLKEKASGRTVITIDKDMAISCTSDAVCLWSERGGTPGRKYERTRLTSLDGKFPDVVFDEPWTAMPGYNMVPPTVLADQVVFAGYDTLVIGDRRTGEVSRIDGGGSASQPIPGGVLLPTKRSMQSILKAQSN